MFGTKLTTQSKTRRGVAAVAVLALVLAACGGDDDDADDGDAAAGDCEVDSLNLVESGMLTVATGEVVFPPWMGAGDDDFDTPESGTGFEGALVFALAAELGFSDDQITFVRTGFDEAIAPGDKGWDFNIQQYSITETRDEVVDFSDPYYTTRQSLVTFADSPYAGATSLADLADAKLGAAIGTTSLDFIDEVIQPNSEASVYDENTDLTAAMTAGQIDGLVVDLPTAYFITAAIVEGSIIAGQFEDEAADPDNLGMLFAEGNSLVSCVNQALGALSDDGTLRSLEDTWLTQDGGITTIAS